jgi:hypothetical protein
MAEFFSPYRESVGAHLMEVLEYLIVLFIILWVETGVTSGSSEYDTVVFTFNLGIIAFVLKLASFGYFLTGGAKRNGGFVNPLQTLGLGSGWRAMWGTVTGALVSLGLSGTTGLSFFSAFQLQFTNTYYFWFLIILGPRLEESFSNTLHPIATAVLKWQFKLDYMVAGTLALLLIVAPMFAVFHYFTYYSKSGANMMTLFVMMLAAYVWRVIFTLGNYFFLTDEFGKAAHEIHNLLGFIISFGSPIKILPVEQLILFFLFFVATGIYLTSLVLFRWHKYGVVGMLPETALSHTYQ